MKEQFQHSAPAGIGGITIAMVFVVLCLTLFSLLSLSTARAQWALTQRSLDAVERYYSADSQAQHQLALLHQRLQALPAGDQYLEQAAEALSDLEGLSLEQTSAGLAILASYPAQGELTLDMELLLTAQGRLTLTRYALSDTAQGGLQEPLNVWQNPTPANDEGKEP